ncbi:iron chelate uptake ABC transporter family permease subunit [Cryomorpha ignava]|uniref:Iron chelate uptake ABC transporter family permease subunit n=1 Tax=Cryomorpha ignava TaxID=101383 RepID=A0A7K3WRH6_9FLAO|nr:iron chelate uptake ABC transporter family permease subunit [Cryomorpha ignava]NEN24138.1 iron chelate uptake ABC transporter family permease subunit [Cryomorpha ignava]
MSVNLIWVIIGCALIGGGASLVGTFAFLRKQSLVGDAVAHSLLPGVALSFLIFEEKNLWVLFPGALIAGWLSLLSIDAIRNYSKIKSDTAIAIVLSVFFAVGIVLLTHIQQGAYGNQSGLESFLFGKAASMLPRDIYLFVLVDVILIGAILIYYPFLKLYSFDPDFAKGVGLPAKWLEFLLSTLTVLAVASGIQAVGVVLMAALIITPAAAARFYTKRLSHMLFLALAFGMTSAVGGVLISYTAPSMPTGPWIVVILSLMAIFTFLMAPRKGIIHRNAMRKKHVAKMNTENVLKLFYIFQKEKQHDFLTLTELSAARHFESRQLQTALKKLEKQNFISRTPSGMTLTQRGLEEAMRVVRLHRLWELYLNERMNMPQDHVHHAADAIEHIITPEIEEALLKELGYPTIDPHESLIPGVIKAES